MEEKINIENVLDVYEKEIRTNVKNKNQLFNFEKNKMANIISVINKLNDPNYHIRGYNVFLVKEPKIRVIMSLNLEDKIINHFVTRYALIPKLEKYLNEHNIATRKNMGTEYGIRLFKKYLEKNKKYEKIYALKIDISKYFYNIDHEVLKSMLIDKLNSYEYRVICNIIDSSNAEYINQRIRALRVVDDSLPYYLKGKGLPIGNMTSQFLSIFYLSNLDHYIVHNLHLKYYIRYMDDFVILHHDKEYLKKCLKIIVEKIETEYRLKVHSKKTKIVTMNEGINFLGYKFRIINAKTISIVNQAAYKKVKKRVKEVAYLYKNGYADLEHVFSSLSNYMYTYKFGSTKKIRRFIMRSIN